MRGKATHRKERPDIALLQPLPHPNITGQDVMATAKYLLAKFSFCHPPKPIFSPFLKTDLTNKGTYQRRSHMHEQAA